MIGTPDRRPSGCFVALARDIMQFARGRLLGLAVLTVLAVAAEAGGLLLLIPILKLAGIGGTSPAADRGGGVGNGAIGLESALALYVLLVAVAAAVVAARGVAVTAFKFAYVDDLRRRLHQGLMGLEWRAFIRLHGAHLVHTVIAEVVHAGHGVEVLLRFAGWAVEIPVLLAVALRLSPALTAASLALAGVCLVLTRPLDQRSHALGHKLGQAGRALHADLTDDLAGMRVVRSLGLEDQRRRRFQGRMADLQAGRLDQQRMAGLASAVQRALAAAAAALAVWFALRILGMALADTLVLMVAFARLLTASLAIQDAWRTVLHALPAHGAVQALLARCRWAPEPPPIATEGAVAPLLRHGVRLEDVSFHYAPGNPAALSNIDVEIPARAVTALVGPSGAGKSTLIDLVLGLTAPDQGRVLVDGRPLTASWGRVWRQRVGYVPQDAFLFHDTIRANLTMAVPGADEGALWAALECVAAAGFVRALPAGLETVVGDRGGLLSGGQRQRLVLARALLAGPDLLILDEATSALDAEGERHVLATLRALRGTLTVIIIAHRPSTVRGADHVIVLEAGRIVAAGGRAVVESCAASVLARLDMIEQPPAGLPGRNS